MKNVQKIIWIIFIANELTFDELGFRDEVNMDSI